ncbi:MAG TPA: hypothetical protein VFN55_07695 [Solirubrobacteraceae bacterium]|nr:hypothetical protein [Solirubrobacteraceae bacterium]
MRIKSTMLATVAASAMTFAPMAMAAGNSANAHAHTPPTHAKAYGHYCQDQSKRHVAGEKGTPFSQCVAALKALDTGKQTNPAKACATASKKHVAGQKGTPYSDCVKAGAKLLAAKSA